MQMLRLKHFASLVVAGGLVLCGASRVVTAETPKEPTKEQAEFFEKKIRPVLAENCYKCHSAEAKANKKLKGKFYADTWEGLAKGGDSGEPAVVPGDPEKSMLIKGLRYGYTGDEETMNMPPKQKDGTGGKLPAEVIKNFEEWVKMGAPYVKGKAGDKKEGEKKEGEAPKEGEKPKASAADAKG